MQPESDSPLIILLDEIDVTLEKIREGIPQHLKFPIAVKNKTDWNSLMDGFDTGMLQNVIIVMTTNKSLKEIDAMDSSYTREGRVDVK